MGDASPFLCFALLDVLGRGREFVVIIRLFCFILFVYLYFPLRSSVVTVWLWLWYSMDNRLR